MRAELVAVRVFDEPPPVREVAARIADPDRPPDALALEESPVEAGPAEPSALPPPPADALPELDEPEEEPPEARDPLLMEGNETLAKLVPAPPRPRSDRPPRN